MISRRDSTTFYDNDVCRASDGAARCRQGVAFGLSNGLLRPSRHPSIPRGEVVGVICKVKLICE